MLLTLSTTHQPATDLGFLLHKNPGAMHERDFSFGRAHVFYPTAGECECTATLLLEVDPVALVRRPEGRGSAPLAQYVSDRPYVASSFLSVAIAGMFGTALTGRSKERPELAGQAIPVVAELPVLPCRGGEAVLRRLFEPLGYRVEAARRTLDEAFPEWGESPYYAVRLEGCQRVCDLLAHLYVLLPVLDDEKHYFVGDDEVGKLLRRGAGWLGQHPERELIATRYLKHRHSLAREALARLLADEAPAADPPGPVEEAAGEETVSLNVARLDAVTRALRDSGAESVLDLGCGEGRLLQRLLADRQFARIVGLDVSCRALEVARERLHWDRLPTRQQERLALLQGSLTYRDARLAGFQAAAVVEVIEHLDPARLAAFERVLFEFARPGTVVLTTPNAEYNVCYASLPAGQVRHGDHRFEWTRAQLRAWAEAVAARHKYTVSFRPVGPEAPEVGAPTQMAVFTDAC